MSTSCVKKIHLGAKSFRNASGLLLLFSFRGRIFEWRLIVYELSCKLSQRPVHIQIVYISSEPPTTPNYPQTLCVQDATVAQTQPDRGRGKTHTHTHLHTHSCSIEMYDRGNKMHKFFFFCSSQGLVRAPLNRRAVLILPLFMLRLWDYPFSHSFLKTM